jgi:hypothetical protein
MFSRGLIVDLASVTPLYGKRWESLTRYACDIGNS